jgi:hypothetical protein
MAKHTKEVLVRMRELFGSINSVENWLVRFGILAGDEDTMDVPMDCAAVMDEQV